MQGSISRFFTLIFVLAVTLGALAIWLIDPIAVQRLRLLQFDQFQRWQPRAESPATVQVVDIDEASLKAYGQWPWPRTRLAELVQRLHEAGAAAIVLDVLLAEPDRTSPNAMAQLWQDRQVSSVLERLPDHDEVFAHALKGRGVVLGNSLARNNSADLSVIPLAPAYSIVNSGSVDPVRWLQGFDAAVWPRLVFAAAADGIGAMNFAADPDGVIRRIPLMLGLGDQVVPTLSAEALRVAQGGRNYLLRSGEAGIRDLRIGAITVPTNAKAEIWLHYPRIPSTNGISAARVLRAQLNADQLRGQIVLVGSSAAGLLDARINPMGQLIAGVQIHALALEQMLSGKHLQRPHWAGAAEALTLLCAALMVGMVALMAPAWWSGLFAVSVMVALFGGAWYAFVAQGLLLDAVNPALAVLLSFGLASGIHHRRSERQQRWIKQAFSRYVSPNRVAHLMAHPQQLQLSGKRQVCSFVFTDLAGFTSMIEASDPAQLVAQVNDYLSGMLDIVFKFEGTLDRIMGDALVVMFSAPVPQPDHCQRAVDCALAMHVFASAYSQQLQARDVHWGRTRIGVHSGEVIVGNFGGKALFDYRALGDPINTAARLESVNKRLGTWVCISQATLDGCGDLPARAVGRLLLKGKTQALQAYEPLAATNAARCASLADYSDAMRLLQPGPGQQLARARTRFESLASLHPHDPLVTLHLHRLRQGATDDLIVMSEK